MSDKPKILSVEELANAMQGRPYPSAEALLSQQFALRQAEKDAALLRELGLTSGSIKGALSSLWNMNVDYAARIASLQAAVEAKDKALEDIASTCCMNAPGVAFWCRDGHHSIYCAAGKADAALKAGQETKR